MKKVLVNIIHKNRLATQQTRWGIIFIITILGGVWLYHLGPVPVIQVTTPLQEIAPFWYMLSAFPVLGMLVADFLVLFSIYGVERRTVELGFQLGILILISNLRLTFRLPISGHSLLFAYFILRRFLIQVPKQKRLDIEVVTAMLLFVVTSYVKIFWWFDPITVTVGIMVAVVLSTISFYLCKNRYDRTVQ